MNRSEFGTESMTEISRKRKKSMCKGPVARGTSWSLDTEAEMSASSLGKPVNPSPFVRLHVAGVGKPSV